MAVQSKVNKSEIVIEVSLKSAPSFYFKGVENATEWFATVGITRSGDSLEGSTVEVITEATKGMLDRREADIYGFDVRYLDSLPSGAEFVTKTDVEPVFDNTPETEVLNDVARGVKSPECLTDFSKLAKAVVCNSQVSTVLFMRFYKGHKAELKGSYLEAAYNAETEYAKLADLVKSTMVFEPVLAGWWITKSLKVFTEALKELTDRVAEVQSTGDRKRLANLYRVDSLLHKSVRNGYFTKSLSKGLIEAL